MKILLLGSGGREHALAWKLAQSPLLTQLFCAPGNPGTDKIATNINISPGNFNDLCAFISANEITMVVVGPEAPLVDGIKDYLSKNPSTSHVSVIGPSAQGALLEGSKHFAKEFMLRNRIPTASYHSFTASEYQAGADLIRNSVLPVVLKADGLAAGKGVLICNNHDQAVECFREMLMEKKFGKASERVVIEQYLDGIELSVFILTDGTNYKILPEAKDYKRIGEADTGLNTGGMGSVSPVPFADEHFVKKVEDRIILPTLHGLKNENIPYQGFIFFGLMNVKGDPYVIEYNVRLGDPEAEAIIPRIKSDLLAHFAAVTSGTLNEESLMIDNNVSATVMVVSGGYPLEYKKGELIKGLDSVTESVVFHSGTEISESNELLTAGGRVLAVTSSGSTLEKALEKSYASIGRITFNNKYFRNDIGHDLLKISQ